MSYRGGQKLVAEAVGTAMLVATVVGSGIMAETLAEGIGGLALLANTIATGAMLFVLITIFGPVSGAHFNPAVSLVFALRREMPWSAAAAYLPAQIAGGVAGTVLAHAMFAQPLLQVSVHARGGPAQLLSEGVATFSLVMTILGTLRHRPQATPVAVALAIVAGYWFTASTSFANPAVTLARALTASYSGIAPADAPAFMAAQVCGAVAALLLAQQVLGWRAGPAEEPSLSGTLD